MDKFFSFPKPPTFFTNRKKIKDFAKIIEKLPKDSAIIIREYDLDPKEREIFAQEIIDLAQGKSLKILIGKDIALAKKLKADGVHFSDLDKVNFKKDDDLILSFAAHSIAGIDLGIKLKADMIFIAPAFATTSHLDTEPLGETQLREIALKYKNLDYLYPLGGVNSSNIYLLRNLGFASFGAIDFFNNL